jgi:hypothetical protein
MNECIISDKWIPHVAGWIVLFIAGAAALSPYKLQQKCVKYGAKPPDWLDTLLGMELFFFISFGLVQMFTFIMKSEVKNNRNRDDRYLIRIACFTEYSYILLSAFSKLTLGIIVFYAAYIRYDNNKPSTT